MVENPSVFYLVGACSGGSEKHNITFAKIPSVSLFTNLDGIFVLLILCKYAIIVSVKKRANVLQYVSSIVVVNRQRFALQFDLVTNNSTIIISGD